jgi:hypothetical protein
MSLFSCWLSRAGPKSKQKSQNMRQTGSPGLGFCRLTAPHSASVHERGPINGHDLMRKGLKDRNKPKESGAGSTAKSAFDPDHFQTEAILVYNAFTGR